MVHSVKWKGFLVMKKHTIRRYLFSIALIAVVIVGMAYFLSIWIDNTRAQEVINQPVENTIAEPQKSPVEKETAAENEVKYFNKEVISAGLSMLVQSVERSENDAIIEVRWQLKDWRDWKISKASLEIDGQEYDYAGYDLVEGLFQYRDGSACHLSMNNDVVEKECSPSMIEEAPYRVDRLIFKDVPHDFLQKSVIVKITEMDSFPNESQYCEVLDVETIAKLMQAEFPGIEFECFQDPGMSGYRIKQGNSYAEDKTAMTKAGELAIEALQGRIAGIWKFDLSD